QTSDDEHGAERRHRDVLQRCSEEQQHERHCTAATSPTACVLPPAASLMAVRESAPLMANPCDTADATFATPNAAKSWSGSMSYPFFVAKLRAVSIRLEKLISAKPAAAARSGGRSDGLARGSVSSGRPPGTGPTVFTPKPVRWKRKTAAPASV